MWRRVVYAQQQRRFLHHSPRCHNVKNIVEINNATFYRNYPSSTDTATSNPALFHDLSFSLPISISEGIEKTEFWSVLSSSSLARTTFLQILAGRHICIPPTARTYPYLSETSRSPQHDIKYVGFDAERGSSVGGSNVRGAYLSARYESRREETDYSVLDYLTGNTELNALEHEPTADEEQSLHEVIEQMNLRNLLEMPVANLSNGQTRRARIAKALMSRPEILLLDGPFMGLDPNTSATMENVLHGIAITQKPRIIMSLRPEDGLPDWIDHLVVADENLRILGQGPKSKVLRAEMGDPALRKISRVIKRSNEASSETAISKDGWAQDSPALPPGEALVEMRGVQVAYGEKVVLGNWAQLIKGEARPGLWWSLHRGQRCGIFGANGSGKTTMLSLITSDHPQTYSLPIKLFGKSRLPGPGEAGISVFDLQKRMGHSSPEVHAFFPKQLTVRRALESAWADAPLAKPKLTAQADRQVDSFLRWFATELNPNHSEASPLEKISARSARKRQGQSEAYANRQYTEGALKAYEDTMIGDSDIVWAEAVRFRDLSFSSQRLLLFLRSFVANPDLVILDEALSGVDERVRDKALLFLSQGQKMSMSEPDAPRGSVLAAIDRVVFEGLSPEQALLVISHTKEDVPGCLREWICLPEPGEGRTPRTGALSGPLELNPQGWNKIWGKTSS